MFWIFDMKMKIIFSLTSLGTGSSEAEIWIPCRLLVVVRRNFGLIAQREATAHG